MTFLLNAKPVDALALIVHRSAQDAVGRQWVKKLRMYQLTRTIQIINLDYYR